MLDQETNELLTQTGRGSSMGELLRRYWMPIAAASEFDHQPMKPVRLMGEDLVLYKDLSGTYGLIDRHCPHRRADLSYGFVETCGLRCNYHGWLYDERGRCIQQPFDDVVRPQARFKDRITVTAYPVEVKAGLVWAYLGPQPAPLVPTWEPFTWKNGFVQIVFAEVPCNWLQAQENSVDPIHFEWMHRNWTARLNDRMTPYSPRHMKLAFDEFDYGIIYRRVTEDTTESDELWTIGRVCLWPNMLFTGNHIEWRVPIDDENMLSVTWHFSRVPHEREPYVQDGIPAWYGPVKDPQTGQWITSHVMNQDFLAWVGQGKIADRTKEHLSSSDRGVILMRKQFLHDLNAIAQGGDPKATVRDPGENRAIVLPVVDRRWLIESGPLAEVLASPFGVQATTYVHQAGQPEKIGRACAAAMGVEDFRARPGVSEHLRITRPQSSANSTEAKPAL